MLCLSPFFFKSNHSNIQILQKNPVYDWTPPPNRPLPSYFFDFDKILVFSFQIILLCNTICNICYECLTMGFIMFLFFFFRKIQYKINSPSAFYIFVCKKKCTNVSMCLCTFNVKCVNSIILTAILDVTVPD